jgi:hypothetical protein
MLAGWCPVVWAASVIGELNRPPPPAMVLGALPLLQDADLAAGQQHREPVMLLGRPHFTAPQREPVQFDKCHGSVRARAVQAGTGHNPVVTVDDLDTGLTRCSMGEYPVKSTAVVQRANSSPFIAPSLQRTFQVQFITPAIPRRPALTSALARQADQQGQRYQQSTAPHAPVTQSAC